MVDDEQLPERGEHVTVRWPGGEYDFKIQLEYLEKLPDGWLLLSGRLLEPVGQHRVMRRFQVRRVDGEFSLLPKLG
jgi:hypothetical protein